MQPDATTSFHPRATNAATTRQRDVPIWKHPFAAFVSTDLEEVGGAQRRRVEAAQQTASGDRALAFGQNLALYGAAGFALGAVAVVAAPAAFVAEAGAAGLTAGQNQAINGALGGLVSAILQSKSGNATATQTAVNSYMSAISPPGLAAAMVATSLSNVSTQIAMGSHYDAMSTVGAVAGRAAFGAFTGPTPEGLGAAIGYGLGSGSIGGFVGGAIKAAEGGW